ncbi:hypothetical protein HDU92_007799, partial [Lobulomyces angularis]
MLRCIFIILLISFNLKLLKFVTCLTDHYNTPVTASLKSNFEKPNSILYEVLEFVGEANQDNIFHCLSFLHTQSFKNEEELVNLIIDQHHSFMENDSSFKDLLTVSLSSHAYSPQVYTFYQYYNEYVLKKMLTDKNFNQNCDVWALITDLQICSLKELQNLMQNHWFKFSNSATVHQTFSFDHIYHKLDKLENDIPTIILYADILSEDFKNFHRFLMNFDRDFKYVLRYRPVVSKKDLEYMYLSGYGVELAIKSSEYKVVDDRGLNTGIFDSLNDTDVSKVFSENEYFDKNLDLAIPSIQKVEDEDLAGLGIKTAHYIIQSEDPFNSFAHVSQNFPRFAYTLSKLSVDPDITHSLTSNANRFQDIGTKFLLNGVDIDFESFDFFKFLRTLKNEAKFFNKMHSLGFEASSTRKLITSNTGNEAEETFKWGNSFDTRDNNVIWWNDIEKDKRYKNWPNSVTEYLRPIYPGQLHTVRKNFNNVLFVLDFTLAEHLRYLEEVFIYIQRDLPIRFGIIPVLTGVSADANLAIYAFYEAKKIKLSYARDYLLNLAALLKSVGDKALKKEEISALYKKITGNSLDILEKDFDTLIENLKNFNKRLGIPSTGCIFYNGKYLELTQSYPQQLIETSQQFLEFIQMKIYTGLIQRDIVFYNYFLNLPNVFPRRSNVIFITEENPLKIVDLTTASLNNRITKSTVDTLAFYPSDGEKLIPISIIVLGDFYSMEGLNLALEVFKFSLKDDNSRIALINTALQKENRSGFSISELFNAIVNLNSPNIDSYFEALIKIAEDSLKMNEVSVKSSFEESKLISEDEKIKVNAAIDQMKLDRRSDSLYAIHYLGVSEGQNALIVNGRFVALFSKDLPFIEADVKTLVELELKERVQPVLDLSDKAKLTPSLINKVCSLISLTKANLKSEGVYSPKINRESTDFLNLWDGPVIKYNNSEEPVFDIVAVTDPISKEGQKISAVLNSLRELNSISIKLYLLPKTKTEENILKRFHRFVFNTKLQFDLQGKFSDLSNKASFKKIPEEALLVLGMEVPFSWMVRPIDSIYDLDNIKIANLKLSEKKYGIEAIFQLSHILVQGHAKESGSGNPPRGLQFVLGSSKNPELEDTITMANLGYLQLKANPGLFELRIRKGRSAEIYEFESVTDRSITEKNFTFGETDAHYKVIVNSFEGVTLYPIVVKRKPGKEKEDVLSEATADNESTKSDSSFFHKIKQTIFGLTTKKKETINIFSVASGHLYERFLSIMMLSVKKTTKSNVKFWLIEDFLSPSFLNFVPKLAEEFEFEYEFVTYKWPHWLRHQTEKQRTIWGFKILFLDVLFPLSLDKVIFVDADQVVRVDLQELIDLNLEGAVYGMTPFCDNRPEIEGFRFWKQGY